ncbi:MAG: hypothetical protein ACTS5P_00275 [Candidatus Hodgkinia cicadicola]
MQSYFRKDANECVLNLEHKVLLINKFNSQIFSKGTLCEQLLRVQVHDYTSKFTNFKSLSLKVIQWWHLAINVCNFMRKQFAVT